MADFEQIPFGASEFAENPEPRCPCLLLLDTSASMAADDVSPNRMAAAQQGQNDAVDAQGRACPARRFLRQSEIERNACAKGDRQPQHPATGSRAGQANFGYDKSLCKDFWTIAFDTGIIGHPDEI